MIDPAKKESPPLSDEILDKITWKMIKKCGMLVKRSRREIEDEMNEIMIEQMEKIELKFDLI